MAKFYTYAWLRIDGSPYYIGKGCGYRAFRKRKYCPPRDRILILKRNLTEEEAFKHEQYMIFVLGRKDTGTGILHNKTEGGEGIAGYKHTDAACLAMKIANEERPLEKKAEIAIKKSTRTSEAIKNYSEEQKKKLSKIRSENAKRQNKNRSPEQKARNAAAMAEGRKRRAMERKARVKN